MDFDERIPPAQAQRNGWQSAGGSGRGGCSQLILLGIIALFVVLPFTPWGKRGLQRVIPPKVVKEKEIVKERVEIPAPPPPLPDKFVPAKEVNVAQMWNGIRIKNEIEVTPGDYASKERLDAESYTISFQVNVKIPKPNQTLGDLAALNPALPNMLPGLKTLLPAAKVSGFYHYMYELKKKAVQIDITRLDKALSRHNFFDLETVLELEDGGSKQKALLIQGEMDVVSDGSDGDRMPSFDDYIAKSQHFQPTTSYNWPKLTKQPNPLLSRYETLLANAREKAKNGTKDEQAKAKYQVESLPKYIAEMKSRSYLIAQEDPFMVIPLSMKSYTGFYSYAPGLGDYAVVIYGDKIYPAIVGDFGPREKIGEASLRLARELDPKAGPYRRPVEDLKVTYLIFPGSADKPFAQPNLAKWGIRCGELLAKIGGLGQGYALHVWTDRFNKAPETPPPAETGTGSGPTAASPK
ncbi:MAG: glycoside hydrolase family 75 protein [Verrucomicrobiales bacterium]|nr:glycoside hydrolase family 75 protein [Verrucomicrobiales bacterium]